MDKRCFKCGLLKPIGQFYKHPMMADGRLGKCVDCTKADTRKNRLARWEHYKQVEARRASLPHRVAARRAYDQTERGRQAHQLACRNWHAKYPEKKRAQQKVNNAIRDGRLKRQPCEVCQSPIAHGHHEDYSKPLDVRWLCPKHHREAHRGLI